MRGHSLALDNTSHTDVRGRRHRVRECVATCDFCARSCVRESMREYKTGARRVIFLLSSDSPRQSSKVPKKTGGSAGVRATGLLRTGQWSILRHFWSKDQKDPSPNGTTFFRARIFQPIRAGHSFAPRKFRRNTLWWEKRKNTCTKVRK